MTLDAIETPLLVAPAVQLIEVELASRYSKSVYHGERIHRAVKLVERHANMQVRDIPLVPQEHRIARRLSEEAIAGLVQAYRDGLTTTHLRARYELSQSAVIRILHGHGAKMRKRGLLETDIPTASELYCRGKSLVELSDHFGVSANAVRRALIAAGVAMRPRGGSRKENQSPDL